MTGPPWEAEEEQQGLVDRYVRTGAVLEGERFPDLRWTVQGLLPEGCGALVAAPKSGKSWLALDVCLSVAAGTAALGLACGPARPVLYLALEDGPRRLQARSRRLLGPGALIPPGLHYVTDVPGHEALNLIHEWMGEHGHLNPLVVVDTLAKVRRPGRSGDNAYDKDYSDVTGFKRVSDAHPGSTVLLVHHARKAAADDPLATTSGTYGLTGALDFAGVLVRGRAESSAVLHLTGRDIPEGAYALSFDDGRWSLDGAGLEEAARNAAAVEATTGLGEQSSALVEYVNAHPEGVTPRSAAMALSMSNDDAGKYLRRLVGAGRIDSPRRGTYVPVRSVRVSEVIEGESGFGRSDGSDTHAGSVS